MSPAVNDVTPRAGDDRADRLAQRFAVPVLVAALASVPAVFLTLLDPPWETVGSTLNLLSGAVLIAETAVLLAVAEDRRAWLRRNRWLVGLAVLIVPAVIFAVGPLQLLRLARLVGALRIVRIGRILKAGRLLRERSGMTDGWQRAIAIFVTVLSAAFVAVVLADPTSTSRKFVEGTFETIGPTGVVIAGVILAVSTFIVLTSRKRHSADASGGVRSLR